MPLGWECRAKLIKQVPPKPTERHAIISQELPSPGPYHYEVPQICGGNGYSKIRRAPAYTFGKVLKPICAKSALPNAPMFNIRGVNQRGDHKIPGGLITPYLEFPGAKYKVPGPGAHDPGMKMQFKRPPAYSLRLAAKPPYQPYDSWTPAANMYCPPIPKQRAPAYTFGYPERILTTIKLPGPGEHDPNFKYVQKKKPAYSLGHGFRPLKGHDTPSPNTYCEKKFMVGKPSTPAPSFGILHSPYLGPTTVHLKPPDLELKISMV